jgi:DNA-binding NtrC family response regulator
LLPIRGPLVEVSDAEGDRARLPVPRSTVPDFLAKPVDPDMLRVVVARALERARLAREVATLRAQA